MSPLRKQVHKMSFLECIGRSKYGVTIFFLFIEPSVNILWGIAELCVAVLN